MNPRYRELGSSSSFRCSRQGLREGENLPLDHEAYGDQPDKADIMHGESALRNFALLNHGEESIPSGCAKTLPASAFQKHGESLVWSKVVAQPILAAMPCAAPESQCLYDLNCIRSAECCKIRVGASQHARGRLLGFDFRENERGPCARPADVVSSAFVCGARVWTRKRLRFVEVHTKAWWTSGMKHVGVVKVRRRSNESPTQAFRRVCSTIGDISPDARTPRRS